MPSRRHEDRQTRRSRFEQFEQRLVMSAQSIVDAEALQVDATQQVTKTVEVATEIPQVIPHSTGGSGGSNSIQSNYGFDGSGQTVAIIDSGIAWDHVALGGGYGEDYRVVGGWDFAENDANPYDDGPAGFHGTHVAGIVGAQDDQYGGVAQGVDLVGLRVFDDSGYGEIAWVEQALQWVHDNKDNFEHPITTVNLSLGMEWNADNVPEWATLEDEFAQLKADGIFISVAAGNAFEADPTVGVSYPAVSPFVVPVASHDSDGNMSHFSQRNDRVLVAAGEKIKSTAPDHLFTGGKTNGFTGTSGTSQATPYVAGASAILRQANEFMGVDGIDQDMLYQQFMDTANQIYDAVTGRYYHQINLQAAIESVVTDAHADNYSTATDAGVLANGDQIMGTIGTKNDIDCFTFQAQHSGQMTFAISSSHDLVPLLKINNADYQVSGNEITFSVVAGQKYQFSIETADGIGHYDIGVKLSQGVAAENLGTVTSNQFSNLQINGTQWYQITSSQAGIMTVGANWAGNTNLSVTVYDAQMNEIATSQNSDGSLRIDVGTGKGKTFFVKATGNTNDLDLQLTNLVSLNNGFLTVQGTNADDIVSIEDRQSFVVDVNGVRYQFHSSLVENVIVNGNGGNDQFNLNLGWKNDVVSASEHQVSAVNSSLSLNAIGFESLNIDAGTGTDFVTLYGTKGNDHLVSSFAGSTAIVDLAANNFNVQVTGFDQSHVIASGGFDTATLYGTSGSDNYLSIDGRNVLSNEFGRTIAVGFDRIYVDGLGGNDLANVNDSMGKDKFVVSPTFVHVAANDYKIWAGGFERINCYSHSEADQLVMKDSFGNDHFYSVDNRTAMYSDGYMNLALNFNEVTAIASGGHDVGNIHDTTGRDVFTISEHEASMISSTKSVALADFDRTNAVSINGGNDVANITGTSGNDNLYADDNSTTLFQSDGTVRRVVGMRNVNVDMAGGTDVAFLQGGSQDNLFKASKLRVEFESFVQRLTLQNNEDTTFVGGGGFDEVVLDDFDATSELGAVHDQVHALLAESTIRAYDLDFLEAKTESGQESTFEFDAVDYFYMLKGDWKPK